MKPYPELAVTSEGEPILRGGTVGEVVKNIQANYEAAVGSDEPASIRKREALEKAYFTSQRKDLPVWAAMPKLRPYKEVRAGVIDEEADYKTLQTRLEGLRQAGIPAMERKVKEAQEKAREVFEKSEAAKDSLS